ncbi:MAG: hypothetical protein ACRDNF_16555, partial [Streptosporangiaceae bacterium]
MSQVTAGLEPQVAPGEEITVAAGNPWRLAAQTFTENKTAVAGLMFIVLMAAFSFLGPIFYHTNQLTTNLPDSLRTPSAAH